MTNPENERNVDDLQWLMHVAAQTGKSEQPTVLDFDPEIDRLVSDFVENEWDESKFDAFSAAYAHKPGLISLLRRQLRFELKRARSGEFPTHLIESLKAKANSQLPSVNEEIDFSILFYPATSESDDFIQYEITPTNVLETAEMVRSENEPVRRLTHVQEMNHCRINVTVELSFDEQFVLTLEFDFIDPAHEKNVSIVLVQKSAGDREASLTIKQTPREKLVTFEKLAINSYTVEIRSGDLPFDSFRLRLTKGT